MKMETPKQKLEMVLQGLVAGREKTLIPPDHMAPSQANGYMQGATAAFNQMAEMAEAVLGSLEGEN